MQCTTGIPCNIRIKDQTLDKQSPRSVLFRSYSEKVSEIQKALSWSSDQPYLTNNFSIDVSRSILKKGPKSRDPQFTTEGTKDTRSGRQKWTRNSRHRKLIVQGTQVWGPWKWDLRPRKHGNDTLFHEPYHKWDPRSWKINFRQTWDPWTII